MNIYVHIGSDKTGSTAIQSILSQHRSHLRSLGIEYPKLPDKQDHHESLVHELRVGQKGESWHELEKIFSKNPSHVILSAEAFCTLKREEIKRFKEWLNQPNVKIIAYLRRADEYLESGILQRLKSAKSLASFKKQYFSAKYLPTIFDPYVFNAAFKVRFIKKWERSYQTSIIVRPYDKIQWEKQDLIYDLLTKLGLSAALNIIKSTKINRNVTPSIAGIYATSILSRNRLLGLRHQFSEALARDSKLAKRGALLSWKKRATARALATIYLRFRQPSKKIEFSPGETPKSEGLPKLTNVIGEAEDIIAGYLLEINKKKVRLKRRVNRLSAKLDK
ncbi:hypothetical protein [Microbulbifer sp. TRSA007]|uniref:hypothetical protein n=1 Tax=Microbulbifer sp. TRSA007 TaxID=3243384 RepID=UPI00403A2E1B